MLACATLYLSCARDRLHRVLADVMADDEVTEAALAAPLNTLKECEMWYMRRITFIRASALSSDSDPQFIEFIRNQIYGETNSASLGSAEVNDWQQLFLEAKTKSVLKTAATSAAAQSMVRNMATRDPPGCRSRTRRRQRRGTRSSTSRRSRPPATHQPTPPAPAPHDTDSATV